MESVLLKLFTVGAYFVKLRFRWSVYGWNLFCLYGLLAVTCIGTWFSGVGCSIFEIDLVKQPFCVRTIFFDVLFRYAFLLKFTLVDSLLFYISCRIYFLYIGFLDCLSLEIDFGILGSSKKKYFLYCSPMLSVFHYAIRDLVFRRIVHFLFPILHVLCGAVSVPCEQTYTFVIYIWIYLGSRTNQHKVWSVLLFYMVWSCRICRWDLPIGTQYTWHDCPLYMWRWCPILGRWVHALEIWSMACHPICVIALSAGGWYVSVIVVTMTMFASFLVRALHTLS